jgi:hypothetical protein
VWQEGPSGQREQKMQRSTYFYCTLTSDTSAIYHSLTKMKMVSLVPEWSRSACGMDSLTRSKHNEIATALINLGTYVQ